MNPKLKNALAALALAFGFTISIGLAAEPAAKIFSAAEHHWAFQPLHAPSIPKGPPKSATRNSIDVLIQARLAKTGLSPNREASRETLIRRVAFTLTGLPPTPGDLEIFIHDRKGNAYESMVQRYLDSPGYGERWAKHWLDTAGYADSNGYFNADSDRPLAYRYRDYVIRSFNHNKSFDVFVREQ